jgi:protein involved in polysaccharide export with SLBB domain
MRLVILLIAVLAAVPAVAQHRSCPVPPGDVVVVEGKVIRPGVYPVVRDSGKPYTVSTALAEAGGLDVNASRNGIVWRIGNDGMDHPIFVSLRNKLDFELLAGDILEIPNTSGKKTGKRCLSVIAS